MHDDPSVHGHEDERELEPFEPVWPARARGRTRRRTRKVDAAGRPQHTAQQRLLILDTWIRSKLSAREFAEMVGVSQHTLYKWKQRFEQEGPAGLTDQKRGARRGSRLPEVTRRAIVMLKEAHPDWGEQRIHDVLTRTEGYGASPGAIARVLEDEGWVAEETPTRPHPPKVTRFERARANELWQTDLFTFTLKREGRRVYLVAFMDDYSRFVVGFGLHASSSGALVREVFSSAIANFGAPTEVLTDNGTQYHTWRGVSEFTRLCQRKGVRQIIASPRRPQTLGKIGRFWGTLWRECAREAIFRGLEDARRRIALFIDHYNFQRPHQGIGGLVPADRYFEAAKEVRELLARRVAANALDLARHGEPRKPFYLTGRVGDANISLHAEGERVVLVKGDGSREEVDLGAPGQRADEERTDGLPEAVSEHAAPADVCGTDEPDELAAPGTSALDGLLERLRRGLDGHDDANIDVDAEDDDDEGGAAVPVGGAS
jgi:transposase InsO family protein